MGVYSFFIAGQENCGNNGRSRSRTRTKGASINQPLSTFVEPDQDADSNPKKSSMVGRVESIRQFLLHGKSNQNQAAENDHLQCNCRHHHQPLPPFLPPPHPHFNHPPPNLIHRRSKSSERLNARMTLAPPASLITPTTAALIGPFIFYQPQEVSRYENIFVIGIKVCQV